MECTLNYLWNNQQQVILLYEQNRDQCSAYMNRIGHFFQVKTISHNSKRKSICLIDLSTTMAKYTSNR